MATEGKAPYSLLIFGNCITNDTSNRNLMLSSTEQIWTAAHLSQNQRSERPSTPLSPLNPRHQLYHSNSYASSQNLLPSTYSTAPSSPQVVVHPFSMSAPSLPLAKFAAAERPRTSAREQGWRADEAWNEKLQEKARLARAMYPPEPEVTREESVSVYATPRKESCGQNQWREGEGVQASGSFRGRYRAHRP